MTKNDSVCKTEWCYHEDQFILASQSYIVICMAFLCTMLYTFQCVLHTLLSMSPFLFYQSHPKAGAVNQIIHPCFCKRLTIGQLNVQAATAEDEEQYTLT